jgi:hypothetical protein
VAVKAEIKSSIAENLFWGSDGDVVDGWTRITDEEGDDGRWERHHTLVVQDPTGRYWGIYYSMGLTENQDHTYPWKPDYQPAPEFIDIVEMYGLQVTSTVWKEMV